MKKNLSVFPFRAIAIPLVTSLAASVLSVGCIGLKKEKSVTAEAANVAAPGETVEGEADPNAAPAVKYVVGENAFEHKIVSGDSISLIGQKYGVTMASIRAANNLTTDKIIAGETLIVPGKGTAPESTEVASTSAEEPRKPSIPTDEDEEADQEEVATPTETPAPVKSVDDRVEEIRKTESTLSPKPEPFTSEGPTSLSPRLPATGGGFNSGSIPAPPSAEDEEFVPIAP